jgi:hypothetical protein
MKSGKGKSKGSSFERLVAKKLTMFLTGQDAEYFFYRSPGSGAVATMNEQNGEITGDIIAIKPEARVLTSKFSIECKDGYADVDTLKIFKNNKNDTLKGFWQQCIRDSRITNKKGMLIFRKKGYPILVGIEEDIDMAKLMKIKINTYQVISFSNDLPKLLLFEFDTFLNNLDTLVLKQI